jgi:hypothetical protein
MDGLGVPFRVVAACVAHLETARRNKLKGHPLVSYDRKALINTDVALKPVFVGRSKYRCSRFLGIPNSGSIPGQQFKPWAPKA